MNERLNYIYLFSNEGFVPTTIYFFNNNTWSEAAPAYSNNDEGKVIDVEVTSNGSTDYYTCNYGDDWLTHVIHWEEPMTTTTTKAFVTTTTTTTTIGANTTAESKISTVHVEAHSKSAKMQHPCRSPKCNVDVIKLRFCSFFAYILDNNGSHLGEIMGIAIGAVCAIAFITACFLFAWRRTQKSTGRKRRDDEG
ncbi:unnamed protein product [Taenia asiatica]|uniref:Ig-like domain-containing protein n=1 Tax=Taenia asiatica TaxID=60517 RepID=A0A0R3VWV2_TAEAS|nr:unnamed protein product [Taenia asiatica]